MSDALPGLDQLRELPLPAAVPYWPQTWGWAVVAVLLVAAGGWAALAYVRRRHRNRYRREALRELESLVSATASDPLAARALPALLKRTAMAAQRPGCEQQVAALSGRTWVAYLQQGMGSPLFSADSAQLLTVLAYSPDPSVRALDAATLRGLFAASRHWIERHHVAA